MRIDRLAAPELTELWSLREDVTVLFGEHTVLRTSLGDIRVDSSDWLLREALRRMVLGPVSLGNVVPGFPGYEVSEERWNSASRELIRSLDGLGLVIVRHVAVGDVPLLSVVPVSARSGFRPVPVPPGEAVRLREGVEVRCLGSDRILEHVHSDYCVELHGSDAARLFDGLGKGDDDRPPALPASIARAALCYAAAAGMVTADGRAQRALAAGLEKPF